MKVYLLHCLHCTEENLVGENILLGVYASRDAADRAIVLAANSLEDRNARIFDKVRRECDDCIMLRYYKSERLVAYNILSIEEQTVFE